MLFTLIAVVDYTAMLNESLCWLFHINDIKLIMFASQNVVAGLLESLLLNVYLAHIFTCFVARINLLCV